MHVLLLNLEERKIRQVRRPPPLFRQKRMIYLNKIRKTYPNVDVVERNYNNNKQNKISKKGGGDEEGDKKYIMVKKNPLLYKKRCD